MGEDVIAQVRRRLHHATGVARGAYASAFAGESHEVVVSTVAAAGAGKAVGKDAAFGVFAKRLAHIWLGGCGDRPVRRTGLHWRAQAMFRSARLLVQQRALRMARVVEFGLRYGRHKYCVTSAWQKTPIF